MDGTTLTYACFLGFVLVLTVLLARGAMARVSGGLKRFSVLLFYAGLISFEAVLLWLLCFRPSHGYQYFGTTLIVSVVLVVASRILALFS